MYLTDVVASGLFYIAVNHCERESRGINVAARMGATFIARGTSVITPIKHRMGLLSSYVSLATKNGAAARTLRRAKKLNIWILN